MKKQYTVVPIYSYDDLKDKYYSEDTGYNSKSQWFNANLKYSNWTKNKTQMFFVIEQKDFNKISPPKVPYKNKALTYPDFSCYDEYGMSLIAILVDVKTNKLLYSKSRWNKIILPKSGRADTLFESWQQLNQAVGMNVESICKDKCAKLKDLGPDANKKVAQMLTKVNAVANGTIKRDMKQHLTQLNIPNNVKRIEKAAFDNCEKLVSVTIPDSVTTIGRMAFAGCSKLKSVEIPASVKDIEYCAFNLCHSLTSVTIPNGVTNIGEWAFGNCSKLASVEIPDSVTNIGHRAFFECFGLKSVVIGNGVTSIDDSAFDACRSLTSLKIGDSVESIGQNAFYGCRSLTSVEIPASVTSLGYDAFGACKGLTNVVFKGKTRGQLQAMDEYPWGIKNTAAIKTED